MIVKAFLQNKKGSRFRSKFNEKTLQFIKEEELLVPALYQYGFIPGTLGDDGDCIDIWLISEKEYDVGKKISCRVLGMLEMTEEDQFECENDFKIFCCPPAENIIITENIILDIKTFTLEIFKRFPEITIKFGNFLPAEIAEYLLNSQNSI